MERIVILLSLVLSCGQLAAQSNATLLQGEVVGAGGSGVDYFNLLIVRAQDSTVVAGSSFYTKRFEYQVPASTVRVLVRISTLGYKDCYVVIPPDKPTVDIGTVTLAAEMLGDVVVRPQAITNTGSKITVHVAGTTLQHLGSVQDILQRAPMVTADDDKLQVVGRGVPLVYIDGKISSYDALKQLQPTQIVSMQVDRNPSARYDAQYRSVLKISTTRRREGVSGQIYNLSTISRTYNDIVGGHIQVNKGRWQNYLGVSYGYTNWQTYSDDVDVIDLPDYQLLDSTRHSILQGGYRYNIEYGTTFKITDKQSLSWQYDFSYAKNNHNRVRMSQERLYENGVMSQINSTNALTFSKPEHKINLMYQYQIGEAKKLEVTVDYGHSLNQERQDVARHNVSDGSLRELQTSIKAKVDVFSVMSEYSFPLLKAEVVVGGRYNRIASRVGSSYDEVLTVTHFQNDVIALYATLDKNYGKWGYELGLRGEFLKDNVRANNASIRNRWSNYIFPSVAISTDGLFKSVDLALSYRSSITHPTLNDLNPAHSYYNSMVIGTGNPLLDAMIYHSVELSATLWRSLTLLAGYDYNKDAIVSTGVLTEDRKMILFQPINIPSSHKYMLSVSYNKEWDKFNLLLNGAVSLPYSRIPYMDTFWLSNKTSYMGSVNFDVKLSPTTLFTTEFSANSRSYDLMTIWEPSYSLTFSMSQRLFKKRMTVVVTATDVLHRSYSDWSDRYGYYSTSSRGDRDTRGVRITLRYNFNGDQSKFRKKTNSDIYDRVN